MAVLAVLRYEGDPDEHLAAYDRELQHPLPQNQPQRLSHTCARGDDGILVVDVWESEEAFWKMIEDPEFQTNEEAVGWPTKPQSIELYEVHATIP